MKLVLYRPHLCSQFIRLLHLLFEWIKLFEDNTFEYIHHWLIWYSTILIFVFMNITVNFEVTESFQVQLTWSKYENNDVI